MKAFLWLVSVAACVGLSGCVGGSSEYQVYGGIELAGGSPNPAGGFFFGVPGRVSLERSVTEPKACTLEKDDWAPAWDCTNYRKVKGTIRSVNCLPKEACTAVSFLDDRGTFLAVQPRVKVVVVADFEGSVETKEAEFAYAAPTAEITVVPSRSLGGDDARTQRAFEGGDVRVCASSPSHAPVTFEVTFGGSPLPQTAEEAPRGSTCAIVRPDAPGVLTVSSRLVSPSMALDVKTAVVDSLRDITSVVVMDSYCFGQGLQSFPLWEGKRGVGFVATATGPAGEGFVPGQSIRIEGAQATQTTPKGTLEAFFLFTDDALAEPVAVIDSGVRTWRFPIARSDGCGR